MPGKYLNKRWELYRVHVFNAAVAVLAIGAALVVMAAAIVKERWIARDT